MQKIECRFTVYFEDPFWVGVYERIQEGTLEACRIVFGPEPRDYQVYGMLLEHWHTLRFSPPVDGRPASSCKNPKRMQREITKQLSGRGPGTKSQQALKLQQEAGKQARRRKNRLERETEQRRQFQLRQQKKKQKKKGR